MFYLKLHSLWFLHRFCNGDLALNIPTVFLLCVASPFCSQHISLVCFRKPIKSTLAPNKCWFHFSNSSIGSQHAHRLPQQQNSIKEIFWHLWIFVFSLAVCVAAAAAKIHRNKKYACFFGLHSQITAINVRNPIKGRLKENEKGYKSH